MSKLGSVLIELESNSFRIVWEFLRDVFVASKPGVLLAELVVPVDDTVLYPSLLLKLGLALVLLSYNGLLMGGNLL